MAESPDKQLTTSAHDSETPHVHPQVWPSRKPQYDRLRNCLSPLAGSRVVYAWGAPATGKNAVIDAVLRARDRGSSDHVRRVDCVVAHTDRALLSGLRTSNTAPYSTGGSSISLANAIALLEDECAHRRHHMQPPLVLVLERAERLLATSSRASLGTSSGTLTNAGMNAHHTPLAHTGGVSPETVRTLLRLPTILRQENAAYIRVIFISRLPWPMFRDVRALSDVPDPLSLYFPPFTEPEALYGVLHLTEHQIRSGQIANTDSEEIHHLYAPFCKAVMQVLYPITNDVREISRICIHLFPQYVEPLHENPKVVKPVLWNKIQEPLRNATRMLYRRALTNSSHLTQSLTSKTHQNLLTRDVVQIDQPQLTEDTVDDSPTSLGKLSKLVLIASFLGSHNPPKTDVHYFTSHTQRKARKVRKGVSKSSLTKQRQRVVQTSVSLNRLLAIMQAIEELEVTTGVRKPSLATSGTSHVLVNISSLVALSLLQRDASGDALSEPKYRCHVSRETAVKLARDVNISLHNYIHDEFQE